LYLQPFACIAFLFLLGSPIVLCFGFTRSVSTHSLIPKKHGLTGSSGNRNNKEGRNEVKSFLENVYNKLALPLPFVLRVSRKAKTAKKDVDLNNIRLLPVGYTQRGLYEKFVEEY